MIEKYKLYTGTLLVAFWVYMCWGFLSVDILPFLEKGWPLIRILSDVILVVLGIGVLHDKRDKFVLFSFLAIVYISARLNGEGWVVVLNGVRDYIPLLMIPPILRWIMNHKKAEEFVESFDRQLEVFLYIQAVVITIQFMRYGAGDYVGGTIGNGGSGAISTQIYVISFYLMIKRWDFYRPYLINLRENAKYIFLLYPTLLNETKISFLFMVLYIMCLLEITRTYILRLILLIPVILCLLAGSLWIYINSTGSDKLLSLDYLDYYLTGGEQAEFLVEFSLKAQETGMETDELFAVDLPRFTKIILVPDALEKTSGGLWFGAAPGQFKGDSVLERTNFAKVNRWMMSGTTMTVFRTYIELGYMGLIWLVTCLLIVLYTPNAMPYGKNIRLFLAGVWFLIIFYDPQFSLWGCTFIMFYVAMSGLQPKAQAYARKLAAENNAR